MSISSQQETVNVVEVRTRIIPTKVEGIAAVVYRLLKEKFTGRIIINVGQGSVTSIAAEEIKRKLS